MALKTLTSEHRDLQQISLISRFHNIYTDHRLDTRHAVGEAAYGQWMNLDRILVQLWESRSIRTRVCSRGGDEEPIKSLLPETTKRGALELADNLVLNWYRYVPQMNR
jgi:hypothetical protein